MLADILGTMCVVSSQPVNTELQDQNIRTKALACFKFVDKCALEQAVLLLEVAVQNKKILWQRLYTFKLLRA
jgi:hypothetical protein